MSKFKSVNGNTYYRHWYRWYWLTQNIAVSIEVEHKVQPTQEGE